MPVTVAEAREIVRLTDRLQNVRKQIAFLGRATEMRIAVDGSRPRDGHPHGERCSETYHANPVDKHGKEIIMSLVRRYEREEAEIGRALRRLNAEVPAV